MVHNLKPSGDLRPLGSRSRVSWKRLLLVLLLLLLLVVLPLWWWFGRQPTAKSLNDTALVGERGPGCVRVVIASDESGSMREFIAPRDQALAQLLSWSPGNLRSDDELAVLAFSGDTFVAMAPTQIAEHPVLGSTPGPTNGTSLSGLIATTRTLPASRCTTSLILLSDGKFLDMPNAAGATRDELRDVGIDKLFLLVPGKDIEIEPTWNTVFPYAPPLVFDGTDPDKTGLAFGGTLAGITGQRLEVKR